jgi:hypothetical protein
MKTTATALLIAASVFYGIVSGALLQDNNLSAYSKRTVQLQQTVR